MPIRSSVRLTVGVLAVFAAGCGSLRTQQSGGPAPAVVARAADKNSPAGFDNKSAASSWPGVTPAAGANWQTNRPAGSTWPDATRPVAGEELGAGQPVGEPLGSPRPVPLPLPPGGYPGSGYGNFPQLDGNALTRPSAVGGIMQLAPHETPMDRAMEFTRKIEQMGTENKALMARIQMLEAAAEAREVALNETLRDARLASEEVARTKAEIVAVRKELAALKARVMQMEKDDTERLKALIAAIEKMLAQYQSPPTSDKK